MIREGLAWVLGQPMLRAIAGCTGTSNPFGNVANAVLVLFAVRQVGLTPALLGLVYAGGSVGGGAGALAAQCVGRRVGIGPGHPRHCGRVQRLRDRLAADPEPSVRGLAPAGGPGPPACLALAGDKAAA
jgi:hypothetical protein